MDNSSNPVTANPQDIGQSIGNQDNSSIQDAVDDDALRQQQTELNVINTGEPASEPSPVMSVENNNYGSWIIAVGIIVVIGVYVLVKLIKESSQEEEYVEEELVEDDKSKPKKSAPKKKSAKKKSAPNQRLKKVSKNKR